MRSIVLNSGPCVCRTAGAIVVIVRPTHVKLVPRLPRLDARLADLPVRLQLDDPAGSDRRLLSSRSTSLPAAQKFRFTVTLLRWVKLSSMPSSENSRPRPLCL